MMTWEISKPEAREKNEAILSVCGGIIMIIKSRTTKRQEDGNLHEFIYPQSSQPHCSLKKHLKRKC